MLLLIVIGDRALWRTELMTNLQISDRAKQGLSANCLGTLDVEFQRIIKIIKIPDSEGGIAAAAKSYGASKAPAAKKPSSSGGAAGRRS